MDPIGLAISQAGQSHDGVYSHRIRKLAECLERRRIPCDLFYLRDNPPLDIQTSSSLFMPLWLPKLRKYDFIYCGDAPAGQTLLFCRPFLSNKIILDVHSDEIAQSEQENAILSRGRKKSASLRVKAIHHMSFAVADHFLTVSTNQLNTFVQSGMSRDSITLIRNGVDLDVFRALPQPEAPEFTFGYAGGYQLWQNLDIMVRAFEIYPHPEHRMLLVGFRERDSGFKKMLNEKFGQRVSLVDFIDQERLVQLLRSVSVLITAGGPTRARWHCFPTKFAEYAALGRPVLVNDVDESAAFVREYHCGFVAEPTPEGMAKTMAEAAAAPYERLVEMGARARSMAEEIFSWDKIGDEYARLVRRLTSRPRASS